MGQAKWAVVLLLLGALIATSLFVPIQRAERRFTPDDAESAELAREWDEMSRKAANGDPKLLAMNEEFLQQHRERNTGEWLPDPGAEFASRWGWAWSVDPIEQTKLGHSTVEYGERVRWELVFAAQGILVIVLGSLWVFLRRRGRRRLAPE